MSKTKKDKDGIHRQIMGVLRNKNTTSQNQYRSVLSFTKLNASLSELW